MNHRLSAMASLTAMVALVSSPAFAHAHLVSSNPAANATVTTAPQAITLTFSEKLVPAFSKFEVTMPEHGSMKVAMKTEVSSDGKTMTGTPQAALVKGAYKIVWTAASLDGHKMTGEVAFKVG